MCPDLTKEELLSLHKEAMDLYNLYFKADADLQVNVKPELSAEIHKSKCKKETNSCHPEMMT